MNATNETEEAALIWEEYKYRHEHCWTTVFRLTSASVLLGVVPYLPNADVKHLRWWLLVPPVVAVGLIVFAWFRMLRELDLLGEVKDLHRKRQDELYPKAFTRPPSSFTNHVKLYLLFLLSLAIVNVAVGAANILFAK